MDLDADAQAVRQAVGLAIDAMDLPLERITLNALAMVAGVVLAGVITAVALQWARLKQQRRRVAPTMYLPRHPLRKQASRWRARWWKLGRRAEPDQPRYAGMGTDEQRKREERQLLADLRRAHRPNLLPGESPWSGR